MIHQLSRYGATGLIGTAVHYAVMYWLLQVGSSPVIATLLGAVVGALVNFLGCRQWVFKGTTYTVSLEAFRFALASGLSLVTNTTLVWMLTETLGVWTSQLMATLCSFIVGYLTNRHWTFSTATHKSS